MIKNFIHQFLHLVDSGKLLKSPYKWLYVLSGALCFLPLLAFVGGVIAMWDEVITLLGNGFWNNFVSVFVLILFVYALLIFALIGWHFWLNRKNNIDNIIPDNSRIVAIPLVSDLLQCQGQIISIFMVFVPFIAGLLAYVACLLTNGFDIYKDFNFLIYLLAFVVAVIAIIVVAYLYLLLIHFICERIRLLPQISNDVHSIQTGIQTEDATPSYASFALEQPTTPPLKVILFSLLAAVVVALGVAFYISISNTIAMSKSIYKPLKESRIEKLNADYEDFNSFYYDVREACELAKDTAKFEEINYKRLHAFLTDYYFNDEYKQQLEEQAHKAYDEQQIQPIMSQVDSLVQLWEVYIEEHDPASYLIVKTYTDIYEEESWYYTYDRPEYWFSTREPISEVVDANISYVPLNENGRKPSGVAITKCNLKELQKHRSRKSSCYYSNIDDKSFWDRYTMNVTINSVTLEDGTVIKSDALNAVPSSIKEYIANPSDKNLETLIKDQLKKDFVGRVDYVLQFVNKGVREQDPLCFDFVEYEE